MAQNTGTLVPGTIHPFNTEDKFPVADTSELKGGHMQVSTLADRDAIPVERRKELMLVSVIEDGKTYQLRKAVDQTLTRWEEYSTGGASYTHPATHPASMIEEDSTHRFTTDLEKNIWNAKATTDFVLQKIAELVASSPAALDTLNELAAALGNDPNFATTITNIITGKANVDHAHLWESIGNRPTKLSQLTNDLGNYGGFLTAITQAMIVAALGYTPYNASNPADYATADFVRQKIAELVASSPAALDTLNELAAALGNDPNFATTITNIITGKANVDHAHLWESIGNRPTKLSQLTNDLGNYGGFLTAITQAMIVAALGYTPYNASNPADYATADFVRQKIAELVASSPAALDTLNELAAALGNDPNFATTVTNMIAGRVSIDDDVLIPRVALSTNSGDWNSVIKTGVYAVGGDNTWNGSSNTPIGAYGYGQLLVTAIGTLITQLYITHADSQIWVRSKFNASDWQGWRHIIDSAELANYSYATTEHVRQKIAELVASSPAALDTLNELAAALGNDPNFATTITNMLSNKFNFGFIGLANIDADHGQGVFEYDPVPTGTIPITSPNIKTIDIGKYSRRTQLAFPYNDDRIFFRRHNDSAWTEWKELLHTGNFNPTSKAETNHSHSAATQGSDGFMSAGDKAKLDNVATGATKNVTYVGSATPAAPQLGDIWIKP